MNYTDTNGDTTVARFTAKDPASDSPEFSGRSVVLEVAQPYSNHNGGCIVFEPGTERLWVGMGDGGSGGDPQGNAQNPRSLLGKMLVLDFAKGASPAPEIVQTGVRNPWRFSFDRETNALWIGDVGQNEWEEIDFVELAEAAGVDWGWNLWEGSHPFPAGVNAVQDRLPLPHHRVRPQLGSVGHRRLRLPRQSLPCTGRHVPVRRLLGRVDRRTPPHVA